MAQIITKTHGQITVKEITTRIFELLQDNKQFIIVNVKYTCSKLDKYQKETSTQRIQETAC